MATEKRVRGVYVPRHDIEANWDKAENFIPDAGELIVYLADSENKKVRFKFGDGVTVCKNLPFTTTDVDLTGYATEEWVKSYVAANAGGDNDGTAVGMIVENVQVDAGKNIVTLGESTLIDLSLGNILVYHFGVLITDPEDYTIQNNQIVLTNCTTETTELFTIVQFGTTGIPINPGSGEIVVENATYKITTYKYDTVPDTTDRIPYETETPEALLVFQEYQLLIPDTAVTAQGNSKGNYRYDGSSIVFTDGYTIEAGASFTVVEMKGNYIGSSDVIGGTGARRVDIVATGDIAQIKAPYKLEDSDVVLVYQDGVLLTQDTDYSISRDTVILNDTPAERTVFTIVDFSGSTLGESAVYVGTEEPQDEKITVWINPEGEATIDQTYAPESENAQSGVAVAQAVAAATEPKLGRAEIKNYIDQTYAPESENAQSGVAVAQAVAQKIDIAEFVEAVAQKINRAELADYIVEQGVDEDTSWCYRKWASGVAECWGKSGTVSAFTGSWGGNLFGLPKGIGRRPYPILFVRRPIETVTARAETNACFVFSESGGAGMNSESETAVYNVCRANKQEEAQYVELQYYVIGQWK